MENFGSGIIRDVHPSQTEASHLTPAWCRWCHADGTSGVLDPQLTFTSSLIRPLHAPSTALVPTSWPELALQETGPRAKPASLLLPCTAASSPASLGAGCWGEQRDGAGCTSQHQSLPLDKVPQWLIWGHSSHACVCLFVCVCVHPCENVE